MTRGPSQLPAFLHSEFVLERKSIHRKHGDPFPLPRLRKDVRGQFSDTSLQRLVDSSFGSLNDLAAVPFDETVCNTSANLTDVQTWIAEDVVRRVTSHGPPPSFSDEQALEEIVSSDRLYSQEANNLVEFDLDRIKVLKRKAKPIPAVDLLPPVARGYLDDFRRLIERPPCELESPDLLNELPTPYWDPRLKRSRRKRIDLYKSLFSNHLLTFRHRAKAYASFFTVKKKDNFHQRLIIDARQANACHRRPPTTRLATPAGLISLDLAPSSLEAQGYGEVHEGRVNPTAETGDVGDCFYNFLVPQMASWFSLGDWFTGKDLLELGMKPDYILDDVTGKMVPLHDEDLVTPCFCGMAMGWSWSLYLANEAVVHQASAPKGFSTTDVIRDRQPPPKVSPGHPAVGVYVDNIQVFGGREGEAGERMRGIADRFGQLGIPYEVDFVENNVEMESLGMRFNFSGPVLVTPKSSKVWRLWKATRLLIRRRRIHGKVLQIWLGHVTHMFSLSRSCMSALSACYRFVEDHKHHRSFMWPSVRKEMLHCMGLMFLVEFNMGVECSEEVYVGDSADFGYAMMVTSSSSAEIRPELQHRERWRFVESDEPPPVEVPSSTMSDELPLEQEHRYLGTTGEAGVGRGTSFGEWMRRQLNHQVQPSTAKKSTTKRQKTLIAGPGIPPVSHIWDKPSRWELVVAKPWRDPDEHINIKEAKVCLMSLRRATRTCKNLGKLVFTLTDNLVSAITLEKGRSSSGKLNGVCRRACAYQVACQVQWRLRHIPTERNVSDEPSRWFQPTGQKQLGKINRDPVCGQYGHVPVSQWEASSPAVTSDGFSKSTSSRTRVLDEHEKQGCFLEVFSGTGRLTKTMNSRGIPCFEDIEIGKGQEFNLLRKTTQDFLIYTILERKLLYVHFGCPCTVFSRARHNIKHWTRARQKEAEGVSLALFTVRAVRALISVGGYFSIENPLGSTLWQFPPIYSLFKSKDVVFVRWDMCQYGEHHKKPTGLLTNLAAFSGLAKQCTGGHVHQQLRGTERVVVDGRWVSRNRTKGAGAYSQPLCDAWTILVQSSLGTSFLADSDLVRRHQDGFINGLQKAACSKRMQSRTHGPADPSRVSQAKNDEFVTETTKLFLKKFPVRFGQHTKSEAAQIKSQQEKEARRQGGSLWKTPPSRSQDASPEGEPEDVE